MDLYAIAVAIIGILTALTPVVKKYYKRIADAAIIGAEIWQESSEKFVALWESVTDAKEKIVELELLQADMFEDISNAFKDTEKMEELLETIPEKIERKKTCINELIDNLADMKEKVLEFKEIGKKVKELREILGI